VIKYTLLTSIVLTCVEVLLISIGFLRTLHKSS
jgi:hypothetical protein